MADHATQKPDEVKASAEATAKVAVEAKAPEAVTPPAPSVDLGAIKAELLEQLRKEVKAEALADIRADRPSAPAVHVVAKPAETDELLVASICLAGNLPGVDKQFGERTLEAAHKRRNMGLQEMLLRAAKANGYQGDAYKLTDGNLRDVLRASFGSSTHSIANVVGTAYGKFLLNGYTSVESVWDRISMIRPVSDFKAVTGVRVNGGFTFEEVGPAGELKSAEATDEARSFGAKSYGRISAISRRDIINDDLGALTVVPTRLGRGAALRFNTNFWTEFQASNATYFERATAGAGNALSLTSLKAAVSAYRKVTDADGSPLSVAPAMLLLPPELEIAGAELMGSALIHGTSGAAPSTNVLAGRYQVVSSVYLSSASTWWLVANPGDLNAMEVLFLNGNRNPVVEQAEADFDTLGIQVRGYFDFGVAKGEPKSCYRMATA